MNKPKAPTSAAKLLDTMGAVTDIRNAVSYLQPPSTPIIPQTLPPGTVEVVNALFKELQAIFPAWKQAWPTDDALNSAKRSWTKAFIVAGINQIEQIRFGIERSRALGSDFIPSVGKFIALCQPTPEMLGIPTHAKALREALLNLHAARRTSREWSHPAIRHAALQCEMYNLAELTPDEATKVFDRAYDITIRMLVQGQPLEDISIGIGHDSQKPEVELAQEYGDARLLATMRLQGIPADGKSAREQLMAKFGRRVAQ
ncbi:replication protein P [Pseudomonas syringae]|nr:replication protein P [Pseudomonas syringae]